MVRAEVELGKAELWCTPGVEEEAVRAAVEAVGYQVTEVRRLRDDLPTVDVQD